MTGRISKFTSINTNKLDIMPPHMARTLSSMLDGLEASYPKEQYHALINAFVDHARELNDPHNTLFGGEELVHDLLVIIYRSYAAITEAPLLLDEFIEKATNDKEWLLEILRRILLYRYRYVEGIGQVNGNSPYYTGDSASAYVTVPTPAIAFDSMMALVSLTPSNSPIEEPYYEPWGALSPEELADVPLGDAITSYLGSLWPFFGFNPEETPVVLNEFVNLDGNIETPNIAWTLVLRGKTIPIAHDKMVLSLKNSTESLTITQLAGYPIQFKVDWVASTGNSTKTISVGSDTFHFVLTYNGGMLVTSWPISDTVASDTMAVIPMASPFSLIHVGYPMEEIGVLTLHHFRLYPGAFSDEQVASELANW